MLGFMDKPSKGTAVKKDTEELWHIEIPRVVGDDLRSLCRRTGHTNSAWHRRQALYLYLHARGAKNIKVNDDGHAEVTGD
jgi:hypothetical protein